jgi:hypothetical protein
MKLYKKLIFFIVNLDFLLSKSFFYSQSKFTRVLKDIIFSKIYFLSHRFKTVTGWFDSDIISDNGKLKILERGNSLAKYSSSYELNYIPNEFHKIITKHTIEIKQYLGKNFLYEQPICFRNYNIPKEFVNYDIYSNVWHQDSHDGNRMLKIFLLPSKVSKNDGPLYYLSEEDVRKKWFQICDRWSFKSFSKKLHFKCENKFIGEKGDYVILDSSRCMHRASTPSSFRDMFQISLYPGWRKKDDRNIFPIKK